jgi:hypothetical protein
MCKGNVQENIKTDKGTKQKAVARRDNEANTRVATADILPTCTCR